MTKDEALKLALEALEWSYGGEPMPTKELKAMKAIRQVLADQKGSEMTNLRQAAEIVAEKLEVISARLNYDRVWKGMEWEYRALQPEQYLPLRDFLDSQILELRQALAEWTPDDTAYRPNGLSQDSDQLPDTTKMIDKVCIRYWVQDTMESGRWATTGSMSRSTAETLLSDECRSAFPQGEIVELPEMPVDRGAWSDVKNATKWVDELRGDEPNTEVVEPVAYVHLEGWLSEMLCAEDAFSDTQFDGMVPLYTAPPKREDVEPDLLNQTCCGCGRAGGYALYCGWCWNKGDKPVGYVDQSDLDREGHDFWVSRQPSKNSVPLFIRKSNDT